MSTKSLTSLLADAVGGSSYESRWKKVEQAKEHDLPREALQEAESIYAKAVAEKEFVWAMKAWVCQLEARTNIDPDSFSIASMPEIPLEGPVQTAIYDAVLATAYQQMRHTRTSRSNAELQEHYTTLADSLFTSAIADREALAGVPSGAYKPLLECGSERWAEDDDVLSLLTRFALEHAEWTIDRRIEVCRDEAAFYLARGKREAWALLSLKQLLLERQNGDYNLRLTEATTRERLLRLLDDCQGLDAYQDVAEEYCSRLSGNEQLDYCYQYLAALPKARNRHYFEALIKDGLCPNLTLHTEGQILADRPFGVELHYQNLTSTTFTVRRFNGYKHEKSFEQTPRLNGKVVFTRNYVLGNDSANLACQRLGHPTEGSLKDELTLPAGKYVFITKAAGKQTAEMKQIASMRLVLLEQDQHEVHALVLDNETGRPVAGADLYVLNGDEKRVASFVSDQQGEVVFENKDTYHYVYATHAGTDDETSHISLYSYERYRPDSNVKPEYRLFTDRSIYRPGQTVQVAGICYTQDHDETHVVSGKDITLRLRDTNYRVIAEQTVRSNELGSYDASFTLPRDVMPGLMSIVTSASNSGRVQFRVEEYKRPTFEVNVQPADAHGRSFTFGDTIEVEAVAKTYAGVPVQDAQAHYRVSSARVSFWRWWEDSWADLTEGDVSTDDSGIARIPLFLDPKHLSDDASGLVKYRVSFDVTDLAGETHTSSYVFSLSRRSFALDIDAPAVIDQAKTDQQPVIKAINANHETVSLSGTYRLCRTAEDDAEVIASGTFHTGEAIVLPALTAGDYVLRAEATDRDGSTVKAVRSLTLYDSRQVMGATDFTNDFLEVTHPTFSETQEAELFFSPREADAYVGYRIMSNRGVIEHQHVVLDKQLFRLAIPYKAEYGDGVTVQLYYVRNGHLFLQQTHIEYVRPDKRLLLAWSTFRDRLYPGQDEEWTLSLTHPDGSPVRDAELLATMYDASLDALDAHQWNFGLSFARNLRDYFMRHSDDNHLGNLYLSGDFDYPSRTSHNYYRLPPFAYNDWGYDGLIGFAKANGRPKMFSRAAADLRMNMVMEEARPMMDVEEHVVMKAVMTSESAAAPEPESEPEVSLRSNFAETAFFYPHIRTDANGEAHIAFTLPESLTEWRFMGLAHDRDVNFGLIDAHAQARKDFMVQPNMPRFVREGDNATLTARVINLCDAALQTRVRLRILDAETETVIYRAEQPAAVEAGKTTAVTFSFKATDRYPMLICEVTATAEQPAASKGEAARVTSDGERHFLPVLSSRRYMTEAIPFYVMASDDTKDIDVSELFNHGSRTATKRRLVLEFTQHPEWTVIEALDGIKLPDYESAPAYAASLYANTMASRIAQRVPGFEEALQAAAGYEASALTDGKTAPKSKLELNEDLRDILLQESPWLNDAIHESEQRARLLDLFDHDAMLQRRTKAFERLKELQLSDGSWSWFKGMSGSYYITLATCENLMGLSGENRAIDEMLSRALRYLDDMEYKAYKRQRKDKTPLYVGESSLHYLYVCALMPAREVSNDVLRMRREMLDVLASSVGDLTILGRAKAAVVLQAFGHAKEAERFLESAVQYTVTKPGMGRYYATDAAYYSWRDYRIPTQLAVMQALAASSRADKEELISDMKVWLLRQKQTQTWDNTFNTIAAVQFLLDDAARLDAMHQTGTSARAALPTFVLDGRRQPVTIDTTQFLAEQLGAVHTQLPDEAAAGKLRRLTVRQPAASQRSAVAWGALYAQYMEDLASIHQQSSGELKVELRLLDAEDRVLDPAKAVLHVGDRVKLRLVVSADRDMDFVQIRCQRPACLEPVRTLSDYRWMDGRGGYVALHDAATDVFFDTFTRGTMTYDLEYTVDRPGQYLSGIATVQCAYATEFCGHSAAFRLTAEGSSKH